jgi:hypothetical protein
MRGILVRERGRWLLPKVSIRDAKRHGCAMPFGDLA